MLAATTRRVQRNTPGSINERIRKQTEARLAQLAERPDQIARRLRELDREWDVERVLEVNASSLALIGLFLGAFVDAWLLLLPAFVAAFLLLHGLQGWCPPVPLLRRFGVRTQSEIEQERYALKHLRGDFQTTPPVSLTAGERARRAVAAADA